MRCTHSHFGMFLAFALVGCGGSDSGPEKYAVTGSVKFDGAPIEEGQIIFRPTDGSGHGFSGPIKEGSFSFDSTVGSKQVEITAYKTDTTKSIPGPAGPESSVPAKTAYIPEKYNKKTTLTAEVTKDGENYFEFELTP